MSQVLAVLGCCFSFWVKFARNHNLFKVALTTFDTFITSGVARKKNSVCLRLHHHCPQDAVLPSGSITTHQKPGQSSQQSDSHCCWSMLQSAFNACDASFMSVSGAPAGGYCTATCNRCPPGTTPAPAPAASASPSPSAPVIIPPAYAPGPAPAAQGCADVPPNDAFSCADLVSLTAFELWVCSDSSGLQSGYARKS